MPETRKIEYSASVLKQMFIPSESVFSYQNVINNVFGDTNPQTSIYGDNVYFYPHTHRIKNYSINAKKYIQLPFTLNKPLLPGNSPPNKIIIFNGQGYQNLNIFQDRRITGRPLMKFNINVSGPEPSASIEKKYSFNNEKIHYQDKGQIKQEIEEIKKIMMETKESVESMTMRPSGQEDVKPKVDINRISDMVYQNIERSIRMERERRGM